MKCQVEVVGQQNGVDGHQKEGSGAPAASPRRYTNPPLQRDAVNRLVSSASLLKRKLRGMRRGQSCIHIETTAKVSNSNFVHRQSVQSPTVGSATSDNNNNNKAKDLVVGNAPCGSRHRGLLLVGFWALHAH